MESVESELGLLRSRVAELEAEVELLRARWQAAQELHMVVRRILKACRLGGYLTYLQRAYEKTKNEDRRLQKSVQPKD
jgi:hypothetical protein